MAYQKSRQLHGHHFGTTTLEVAMVLPVFFLFVFGLIEYGRIQSVSSVVKNAVRQGARYGATQGVDTEEAVARVKQILGSVMNADAASIVVKSAAALDSGSDLPSTASEYQALPNIELTEAEPRQLFVVRVSVNYEDISLIPMSGLSGMKLTGQTFMRHE